MPVAPYLLLVVEITTKISRHCQMSHGRQNPYQLRSSSLPRTYLAFCSSVMKQTPAPSTIHCVLILPPQHISLCPFNTWKITGYLVSSNNSSLSCPHFSEETFENGFHLLLTLIPAQSYQGPVDYKCSDNPMAWLAGVSNLQPVSHKFKDS